MRRSFCSLSCANSRTKGGLSRKAFHAQARKHRKTRCEACFTGQRLQVHHIDEDWRNNDPANLQTLCIHCHQFWHATHRRLGVKPTQPMPPLFSRSLSEPETESAGSEHTAMRLTRGSRRKSSARISTVNFFD